MRLHLFKKKKLLVKKEIGKMFDTFFTNYILPRKFITLTSLVFNGKNTAIL